jgi:hypothetical protein
MYDWKNVFTDCYTVQKGTARISAGNPDYADRRVLEEIS